MDGQARDVARRGAGTLLPGLTGRPGAPGSGCRWPVGRCDPRDMSRQRFCNAPAEEGSCYCVRHRARSAFDPATAAQ